MKFLEMSRQAIVAKKFKKSIIEIDLKKMATFDSIDGVYDYCLYLESNKPRTLAYRDCKTYSDIVNELDYEESNIPINTCKGCLRFLGENLTLIQLKMFIKQFIIPTNAIPKVFIIINSTIPTFNVTKAKGKGFKYFQLALKEYKVFTKIGLCHTGMTLEKAKGCKVVRYKSNKNVFELFNKQGIYILNAKLLSAVKTYEPNMRITLMAFVHNWINLNKNIVVMRMTTSTDLKVNNTDKVINGKSFNTNLSKFNMPIQTMMSKLKNGDNILTAREETTLYNLSLKHNPFFELQKYIKPEVLDNLMLTYSKQ